MVQVDDGMFPSDSTVFGCVITNPEGGVIRLRAKERN